MDKADIQIAHKSVDRLVYFESKEKWIVDAVL